MRIAILLIALITLISIPSVEAGLGIQWGQEFVSVDQWKEECDFHLFTCIISRIYNEPSCYKIGIFNPWNNDYSGTVAISDTLQQNATGLELFLDPDEIFIPAGEIVEESDSPLRNILLVRACSQQPPYICYKVIPVNVCFRSEFVWPPEERFEINHEGEISVLSGLSSGPGTGSAVTSSVVAPLTIHYQNDYVYNPSRYPIVLYCGEHECYVMSIGGLMILILISGLLIILLLFIIFRKQAKIWYLEKRGKTKEQRKEKIKELEKKRKKLDEEMKKLGD